MLNTWQLGEQGTHATLAHREHFSQLLAVNPNYFGNLSHSRLKPAVHRVSDTSHEQLTGVAYQPDRKVIEATFEVKLPFGFGEPGRGGTWEHVRFWLDYGAGWVDAGVARVKVPDPPLCRGRVEARQLPVSHVASVHFDPRASSCNPAILPKVRAILSWTSVPPAMPSAAVPEPPDWQPVFGNVLDTHIQVAPWPPTLADILSTFDVVSI